MLTNTEHTVSVPKKSKVVKTPSTPNEHSFVKGNSDIEDDFDDSMEVTESST